LLLGVGAIEMSGIVVGLDFYICYLLFSLCSQT